jgi:two-component system nitrate/nitrite response regulator NarL
MRSRAGVGYMAALITEVLVDDLPFFRDGVAPGLILSRPIQLVGDTEGVRQALEVSTSEKPELP